MFNLMIPHKCGMYIHTKDTSTVYRKYTREQLSNLILQSYTRRQLKDRKKYHLKHNIAFILFRKNFNIT